MKASSLTDEQVIDLVKQLPPERKRSILLAIAEDSQARRKSHTEHAAKQLRLLCAERGLDWEMMSEEERETFIDDLIHEDRNCSK